MGYESKIYAVNVHREQDSGRVIFADIVATIDLQKMGEYKDFYSFFNKDIDFNLYIDDNNTPTKTDAYGDILQECNLPDIISWLENTIENAIDNDDNVTLYRRIFPLYGLLKGLYMGDWEELHIVHYGH